MPTIYDTVTALPGAECDGIRKLAAAKKVDEHALDAELRTIVQACFESGADWEAAKTPQIALEKPAQPVSTGKGANVPPLRTWAEIDEGTSDNPIETFLLHNEPDASAPGANAPMFRAQLEAALKYAVSHYG